MKSCNQSGMPCVGSSVSILSCVSGKRFPDAGLSGSVSRGFPQQVGHMLLPILQNELTDPVVSM